MKALSALCLLAGLSLASVRSVAEPVSSTRPSCGGALTQGGLIVCNGAPGTLFRMDDVEIRADEHGAAYFGIRRHAAEVATIAALTPGGSDHAFRLDIRPRLDRTTTVEGLDCDKIDARTDEQKAHAARSWTIKQEGWGRFHPGRGALDGFRSPADGRISSPFGFTRRYVAEGCETRERPHLGYDIAAPEGSPVRAPAAGRVILAEDDLYYEGGTVFLDHGQGLVSIFLHLSHVDVSEGDAVEAGGRLGEVGATGRASGPHLHWGVKWRNPASVDRSGDFYIDPALLLAL